MFSENVPPFTVIVFVAVESAVEEESLSSSLALDAFRPLQLIVSESKLELLYPLSVLISNVPLLIVSAESAWMPSPSASMSNVPPLIVMVPADSSSSESGTDFRPSLPASIAKVPAFTVTLPSAAMPLLVAVTS